MACDNIVVGLVTVVWLFAVLVCTLRSCGAAWGVVACERVIRTRVRRMLLAGKFMWGVSRPGHCAKTLTGVHLTCNTFFSFRSIACTFKAIEPGNV